MKTILSTYNFYPSHKGGTEVYTKAFHNYLKDLGHEVLVIAALDETNGMKLSTVWNDDEILAAQYSYEGINVLGIQLKHQSADDIYTTGKPVWTEIFFQILSQLNWADAKFLVLNGISAVSGLSLCTALLQLNPGVKIDIIVHTPFVCPKADMIYMGTGKRCNIVMSPNTCAACMMTARTKISYSVNRLLAPVLGQIGSLFGMQATAFRLKRLLLKKFEALRSLDRNSMNWIVFSADMGDFLKKQSFISADKIHMIRHGIDKTIFFRNEAGERPSTPIRFLYAGRFAEIKGVKLLCEAWQRINDRPSERLLYLVGNWRENSLGSAMRDILGKRTDIRFMEALPQDQLAELYRNTHCVIIPSQWVETGPLVFHEAIACGCDIISSDLGGQAELAAIYNEDAFLFRSGNVDSLFKAIELYRPAKKEKLYSPFSEAEHFEKLTEKAGIQL